MTYDRRPPREPKTSFAGKRPERYYAAVLVTVLGFSAMFVGLLVQKDWEWWVLALVAVGSCGSAWLAVRSWGEARGRWRVGVVVGGAALLLFVALGTSTQLVIEGEPILAVSDEARANEMISELLKDLEEMAKYDGLLAASPADARARYNDYEPAAKAMLRIANKWSRVDLGSLPDPDLIEVVQHVKTGATFGSKAVELRQQIIVEPDSRAEASMKENRDVFIGEALNAGAKLRPLAEKYLVETYDIGGLE